MIPNQHPVHQALLSPPLLMGMERGPAIILLIAEYELLVPYLSWTTAIIGLTIGPLVIWAGRMLARKDPQALTVIWRSLLYRPRYSARRRA